MKQLIYDIGRRIAPQTIENREAERAAFDYLRVGVVFIHVPRTAGLSILKTLYGTNDIRHFSLDQILRVAPAVFPLPRFTIIRNPWDRAVSAYHFAKHGGGTDTNAKIFNARRYQKPDFATFDTFAREYLTKTNIWEADPVFKPQSYYVSDRPFDHIGRFDNIKQTETWLSETLGREITLIKSNASLRGPYRDYYTPETRDIVAHTYREDIARFGFKY